MNISALSKKTGLSIHTLRFYEKEGLLRHVERTATGRRVYTEASVGCLIAIICLKEAGLSLPQIKEFFDSTVAGIDTLPRRMELLHTAQANLHQQKEELERNLDFVNLIIGYGEGAMEKIASGKKLEDSHPYLTLAGISNFPYLRMKDGKLSPYVPEGEI